MKQSLQGRPGPTDMGQVLSEVRNQPGEMNHTKKLGATHGEPRAEENPLKAKNRTKLRPQSDFHTKN